MWVCLFHPRPRLRAPPPASFTWKNRGISRAIGCGDLSGLEVIGTQPRLFCDTGQHLWADLVFVVEGERDIGPTATREGTVRTGLSLNLPANAQQRD